MFTPIAKEFILRAARKSDEMLEPYEWKRSRTVLRRERASNRPDLADYIDLTANLDGCFIDLMSGEYIINVLEPKSWDDGTGDDEDAPQAFRSKTKLSQHISFLRDFFRSYKDFPTVKLIR